MAFVRLPFIKANPWQSFADVYKSITRINHIIRPTVRSKRHFYFKFQPVKSEDSHYIILMLSSGCKSSTNTTSCHSVFVVSELERKQKVTYIIKNTE